MDAKLEQLEATLNNINVINAGKKRKCTETERRRELRRDSG